MFQNYDLKILEKAENILIEVTKFISQLISIAYNEKSPRETL